MFICLAKISLLINLDQEKSSLQIYFQGFLSKKFQSQRGFYFANWHLMNLVTLKTQYELGLKDYLALSDIMCIYLPF
jgi:hypothetical protein